MVDLDRVFNPRTVAVVGDKKGQGFFWLKSLKTFQGKVYSVQIDPKEIPEIEALGFPNYTSLLEIPDEIDFVICSAPRGAATKVVQDCIRKRVGGVTLFTSGFAETNTEEGRKAQEQLTQMARAAGLKLIGPNCMGIYNPRNGLRFNVDQFYGEPGRVGFISQSGTHLGHTSTVGPMQGVKLAKGVSFGNGIVLDSVDYLEYFAQDTGIDVIGMYVEGPKDGRRFFQVLREVTPRKPVVLWKGGETADGTRAALSHTGNLVQSLPVWQAMVRQCGAIPVKNLDEMLDTLKGLVHLKPVFGPRVGIIALSGGQSVVVSDAYARAGLKVPPLSPASYTELSAFVNIIGGSYQNPFDVNWATPLPNLRHILEVLDRDENVDNIAMEIGGPYLSRRWDAHPEFINELFALLVDFRQHSAKPFLVMLTPAHYEGIAMAAREKFNEVGLPHYANFDRAAQALRRILDYYRFRREVAG